ncbi:pro-sigmaK processing inhibitor BofA family protein [Metallumcola ferriviriculae]|uniref:Pro-sigmaK processing inhibitor BofA family protein n=1 Tax=Metallumcola ferriviriculae TaxID=3039180 RepID=A0AAU0UK32_9FIRM|nr:pro-sigmaK processing inhibitor BofA family protein [Desulfitibacteraceae bacterium MK1]
MDIQFLFMIAVVAIVLLVIFFIFYFLAKPLRWLFKLLYNSLIGLLLLWILNTAGQIIDFQVPINLLTVVIVGFLGIPGLIVVVLFKLMLGS